MVAWLTRIFLVLGGAVASWFVSRDAPNFSVVQGVVAMLLIALTVAVLAFWQERWSRWLNQAGRSKS
jgi:uncharacterized membrane protein YcaP (DUF421 family)